MTRSRHDTQVYYDPYDVDITANPYPTYARLREEAPLYYNERYDFWALSRYVDVEKALSNWETFSNQRSDILELVKSDFDMPKGVMMFEDPPIHSMLRGLMSRVFTPRRMAAIEDQIRRYCVNCLDPLVGFGRLRHRRRTGRDDADARHRHAARHSRVGAGRRSATKNDANLRTKPGAPMKVAKADAIADGRMYADYVEWRSTEPVRRPDDRAAQRRVRRRSTA